MSIPKKVHIAWNNKKVLSDPHPLIKNGLANFYKLNPRWDIQISSDEDIELYLKNTLDNKRYNLVKDIGIVPKTDIWRLLKIYFEGGLYFDIDRLCNKNINYCVTEDIKWVLPICNRQDFSHDFMMSSPFNPVFEYAIDLYFERRTNGIDHVYYLGSQTYMHAITYCMFGKFIDVNPGEFVFDGIINELLKASFINVIVEKPPSNTILFDGCVKQELWETLKRSFYSQNNIRHWTGEW